MSVSSQSVGCGRPTTHHPCWRFCARSAYSDGTLFVRHSRNSQVNLFKNVVLHINVSDVKLLLIFGACTVTYTRHVPSSQGTMLSIDLVAMFLASLSIAFQLSGLLTPGWWIVEPRPPSNLTLKYGIWRTISCVAEDCTEKVTDATGTFGKF